jgi:hypothetical protein
VQGDGADLLFVWFVEIMGLRIDPFLYRNCVSWSAVPVNLKKPPPGFEKLDKRVVMIGHSGAF